MINSELSRDELGAFISVEPNDIPAMGATVFDESKQTILSEVRTQLLNC